MRNSRFRILSFRRFAFSRTARRVVTATVRDSKKRKRRCTNVVDWPALRDSAASDRSFISVRETGNTRRNTHGPREIGDLDPTPVGRAGGKKGFGNQQRHPRVAVRKGQPRGTTPVVPPFARSRSWRRTDDDDVGDAAAGRAGARRAPRDAARAPASTRGRCPR